MINKKKGSAMLLAIVVIAVLLILSISVLTAATSNRVTTIAYDNLNELKMLAQTGADNGLAILKESITTSIKDNGKSVLYKIAHPPVLGDTDYPYSTIESIGLKPPDSGNEIPGISGNYPSKYSVAFNVFGKSIDNSKIQYGDCYIEYIDNTVLNSITNIQFNVAVDSSSVKDDLNDHIDSTNNISKRCIKMTVIAIGKNNKIKRIDAYIDKDSITNYYLEKMAANTFTIIDKTTDEADATAFNLPTTQLGNKYNIGGNIFFRGKSFSLSDTSKIHIDGTIKAKVNDASNALNFTKDNMTDTNGNIAPSEEVNNLLPVTKSFNVNGSIQTGFNMQYYEPLYNTDDAGILTQTQLIGPPNQLDNSNYTLLNDPSINDGTSPFMVIAKCKPDPGNTSVDFNSLIYGSNLMSNQNGLRWYVKYGTKSAIDTTKIFNFTDDSDFAKMFKMIIVYGDLDIRSNSYVYDGLLEEDSPPITPADIASLYRPMTSVNYIIVCLGKVTISGNFNIENSSIFARDIHFEATKSGDVKRIDNPDDAADVTTQGGIATDTNVTIDGVGVNESIFALRNNLTNYYDSIPNNAWGFLDNIERAKMNEYLINNLPNQYAAGLKFKIIDWKEY